MQAFDSLENTELDVSQVTFRGKQAIRIQISPEPSEEAKTEHRKAIASGKLSPNSKIERVNRTIQIEITCQDLGTFYLSENGDLIFQHNIDFLSGCIILPVGYAPVDVHHSVILYLREDLRIMVKIPSQEERHIGEFSLRAKSLQREK